MEELIMGLLYEDIKGKDIVFVDAHEKDRANRFKKFWDNYLDTRKDIQILDAIKDKKKHDEEYFISNKELEYGDYAFNDVVVEFKTARDFERGMGKERQVSIQVEDLYRHSGFKDKALIIVDDGTIHWNDASLWKGLASFNSKVNAFVVSSETKAFEFICHLFWINGRRLSQPPVPQSDNYAMNLLLASGMREKWARNMVKRFNLSTIPQVIDLFNKYSASEIADKLNVPRLTEGTIAKTQAIIKGEPFIKER